MGELQDGRNATNRRCGGGALQTDLEAGFRVTRLECFDLTS